MVDGLVNILNYYSDPTGLAVIHYTIAKLYKKIGDIDKEFQLGKYQESP